MKDFTLEEVLPLAQGLDRKPAVVLLKWVFFWTNGHPYLTQSLCAEIAVDPKVQTGREVDGIVARLFFVPKARERNVNLADVANRMLSGPSEGQSPAGYREEALSLYRQVLTGDPALDDEADRRVGVLKLSGVTRTEAGQLQVRNRIYRKVFDRRWVEANLPEAEIRRLRSEARTEAKKRRQAEQREAEIRRLLDALQRIRGQNCNGADDRVYSGYLPASPVPGGAHARAQNGADRPA
ncbi:MAG: hypothetical protein IT210_21500, partial [Armatimonadetes bacterium]|nr:hypothetical protein [Armatimonadota bacterium]